MFRGENPGDVIEKLKLKINDLNENILPDDIEIVPFIDRTDLVNTTVSTVSKNLIEGILLVSFIVFIFLFNWRTTRSEEHTSELQSRPHLVCRLLLEKKKIIIRNKISHII